MYYPLSQITTNLYSNNEFVIKATGILYSGPYWKTSKGQYFTGKTPQDTPNQELVSTRKNNNSLNTISQTNVLSNNFVEYSLDDMNNNIYNVIKKVDTSKVISLPIPSIPLPSSKDYKIGEFRRYFCKKTNEITYIEINKETYDKLTSKDPSILYNLYFPFSIPWQITGKSEEQVYKLNRNIVELTSKNLKLYKFKEYLRNDFAKYYK